MHKFSFQYVLPENVVPFSTIRGGISQLDPKVCAKLSPPSNVNSTGEINWALKDIQTGQLFSVRQIHHRSNGKTFPVLQSEMALTAGTDYETLKVTSPAPHAANLCCPNQTKIIAKPSVGLAIGTHIMTEHGEIAIENLRPGIRLVTRDQGMQRLRWVGQTRPQPAGQVVQFEKDTINNCRDMVVCANQLLVLKGAEAIMRFGKREVFASARSFVDDMGITLDQPGQPHFYQLMLDSHEVIYAEAAACESFLPTAANLMVLPLSARLDIHLILPNIQNNPASFGPLARSVVSAHA